MVDVQINGHKFRTLGETFFHNLSTYETKDKILQYIPETNEQTSYSEMLSLSIRTAIKLRTKGITRNDIISSFSHNQKYSPVTFIACQLLGVISNAFDPRSPHLDTIHLLKLMQPKILFVAEDYVELVEKYLKEANVSTEIVVFGYSDKYSQFSEFIEPNPEEKNFVPVTVCETETAVVLFSSGTTGLPKGICLSHIALLWVTDEANCFDPAQNNPTVILVYTTLYWISAVFTLIKSVLRQYSCVICRNFDPEIAWRHIENYKVTTMFQPPYLAIDLLKKKPLNVDFSSLEQFVTGGCLVPIKVMKDLIKTFPNAKVVNCYAQTEAAGVITTFDIFKPREYELQLQKPQSCGIIKRGLKWKIVDCDTEKVLGPNKEGELRIKQDGLIMNGYYKLHSSVAFDSEGYLRTGDIAYYDEDECFYVVGRIKEMFKYRGWHIVPTILENIILLHPAVKEAAVVGIPHEEDGDHPMAVVVVFNDHEINEKEIETFVNAKVSDSQRLRAGVKIVSSIPKTSTGKIQRTVLKNLILDKIKST